MKTLVLAAALLAMLTVSAVAQTDGAPLPIGDLLRPDGTLDLDRGFRGSLDPEGWSMHLGADGRPVFTPEAAAGPMVVDGDEKWDDRFGPPGVDGQVNAIVVAGDDVFIGGKFVTAGPVVAYNIARWNVATRTWAPLGTGVGGPVYALAIADDVLYVGGEFYDAGDVVATGIAQYDISIGKWSAMQNGVWWHREFPYVHGTGIIHSILVNGDDVYVGGSFNRAGSNVTLGFADWNRRVERWFTFGAGIDSGTVYSMAVDGDDLIIGGDFTMDRAPFANSLVRLNMASREFHADDPAVDGAVYSVAMLDSTPVIGGAFTIDGRRAVVARLDGERWSPMAFAPDSAVRDMLVDASGNLFVAGGIRVLNGQSVNGIARFNGSAWYAVDVGVGGTDSLAVRAVALSSDGQLIAGGSFLVAGTSTAYGVAGWDGRLWHPLTHTVPMAGTNGTDGPVYAVAVDGNRVYLGGDFTHAGAVEARHIAWWDIASSTWHSMGQGIGGSNPLVRTISVVDGTVYVGGIFDSAGGVPATGIARYDPTTGTWSDVGGGVGGPTPYVFCTSPSDGGLLVGGGFTEAGGRPAARVARWTGSAWEPLGSGVTGDSSEYVYIRSIAVHGETVFVGGSFARAGGGAAHHLAAFDGTWHPVGDGTNAPVSALAVDSSGRLLVAGDFTRAGDSPLHGLARWNGSTWDDVGQISSGAIDALHVLSDGRVLACGSFTSVDTVAAGGIALLDGSTWSPLGPGTNGAVHAVDGTFGALYAGGVFSIAGGLPANNFATWDGSGWSGLGGDPSGGISGIVLTIALSGENVYVGGAFASVGSLRSGNVAMWSGDRWLRLGRGVDGPVRSITVGDDGTVYVGGEFTHAGEDSAAGIARWDGAEWHGLAGGVSGSAGIVTALAVDGTDLFVGGNFTTAGSVSSHDIARYDLSTDTWQAMAGGVDGDDTLYYVAGLAASRDAVYAVGHFQSIGGVAANSVAVWSRADLRWSAMGSGVEDRAYAVSIADDGSVYVGGHFLHAGGVLVSNIARWDGQRWNALAVPAGDTLRGVNAPVYAIGTYGRHVFIGGVFELAGVTTPFRVAWWDGTTWHNLGQGIRHPYDTAYVMAVAVDSSGLWVGGNFRIAGNSASFNFARWHSEGVLAVPPRRASPIVATPAAVLSITPNPVINRATVSFELERSSDVAVELISIAGDRIRTVFQGRLDGGHHDVPLELSNTAAGSYFVELRIGDSSGARRIVHIE